MPHNLEACYGSRNHCWSCDEDEPGSPCFIACLECRHVYATPQDLQCEWVTHHPAVADGPRAGMLPVPDAERIYFCPKCLHDF